MKRFRSSRRSSLSLIGLLGTVLIHGLLALPLVIDLSLAEPRLPNQSGAGASASASNQDATMTVVFINDAAAEEQLPTVKPEELASRGLAPRDLPITVLSPDPTVASAVDAASEQPRDSFSPDAGDRAQHALLYCRYVGQVQARIERAWMRPRAEIGSPQFSCRARIEQDRTGAVIGIKLDHCNGAQRWQESLVSAIRTASPLPAPPDPSVYADRLLLSFHSDGYQSGAPADGFEPAGRESFVRTDWSETRETPDQLARRMGSELPSNSKDNSDVIHLTIIGAPASAGPAATTAQPIQP